MDSIVISQLETWQEEPILSLYRSVGWSAYYDHPQRLKRAFENSLRIYAAFHGETLVGLARLVGDGETIVFLQDLLVRPEYQRRGIGRRLIATIFAAYPHVRQIHLLTDDLPDTVGFYRAVGFIPVEQIHARAFTRLKY